ncbi:MAG: hypothetical protein QM840_09210 [Verrucomicrobiota bacterium]|nr:hypothetical protein [Verrucomicrobiota bacterium]
MPGTARPASRPFNPSLSPDTAPPASIVIPGYPRHLSGLPRRVQGVYIGCTTDEQGIFRCISAEHPWYTPCTPLVHGLRIAMEEPEMS